MPKPFESENKPDLPKKRPEHALAEVFGSVVRSHIEDLLAKRSEVWTVNMQTAFATKIDPLTDDAYLS